MDFHQQQIYHTNFMCWQSIITLHNVFIQWFLQCFQCIFVELCHLYTSVFSVVENKRVLSPESWVLITLPPSILYDINHTTYYTLRRKMPIYHANTDCCCMCAAWWHHQMETFSALLAICTGNSPHRWIPRTKASDAELWFFFYLRLNEQLSKQS